MSNLDKAKQYVALLTAPELLELRNYIAARSSIGIVQPTSAKGDDMARFVLDVIADMMRTRGLDMRQASVLERMSAFPRFRHKLENDANGVGQFIRDMPAKNKVARRALVYVGVDQLREFIQATGTPISSQAIMNHIHMLPAIYDAAFPGYAQSGLLNLVIREKDDVWKELSDKRVARYKREPPGE